MTAIDAIDAELHRIHDALQSPRTAFAHWPILLQRQAELIQTLRELAAKEKEGR